MRTRVIDRRLDSRATTLPHRVQTLGEEFRRAVLLLQLREAHVVLLATVLKKTSLKINIIYRDQETLSNETFELSLARPHGNEVYV